MSLKELFIVPAIVVVASLALSLTACDFIIASNPSPASPLPPVRETPTPPEVANTPTPDPQPTIDALVQRRIAEILTPSPRSKTATTPRPGAPPTSQPTPQQVQFPTLGPAGNFNAAYYQSGFACTGSMRPTIDCGDEGLFLKPPFPGPLMVGDIISFSSNESCRHYKNHNISKAHRIVAVRVENGSSYYTTKGDSSTTPDACEVTIEQIDGKLVELKRGVRPQDVIDTSEYDYAKERVKLLKEKYEVLRASFDRGKAEYDTHGEEYQLLVAQYHQKKADYEEVTAFHQALEEERLALNELKDEINSLGAEINAAIDEVDRIYRELFIP